MFTNQRITLRNVITNKHVDRRHGHLVDCFAGFYLAFLLSVPGFRQPNSQLLLTDDQNVNVRTFLSFRSEVLEG